MIEVYCDNYDCAHCDINRDCCTLSILQIDACGDCASYEEYIDESPRFEFWKCMKDKKTKEIFRKKGSGRKIEIGGLTFYTENSERRSENQTFVTEEKTGASCGSVTEARDNIEKIKYLVSKMRNVLDFPIREEREGKQ